MEEKMVKHIYIIIFVFFGSIFMNACLNIEPKGGGYMIVATRGSQISKSKGVFMNYYDMQEPFEYKDSIIYLKLVFNDVYSETVAITLLVMVAIIIEIENSSTYTGINDTTIDFPLISSTSKNFMSKFK